MQYVSRTLALSLLFLAPHLSAQNLSPTWTPACVQCQKTMMSETLNCASSLSDPSAVTVCMTNAGASGADCYARNFCPAPGQFDKKAELR